MTADALAITGAALLVEDSPGETFVRAVTESALSAWECGEEKSTKLRQAVLAAQRTSLLPWLLGIRQGEAADE